MEDFDSFHIAPILLNQEGDKGLYEEIAEAMQLLGLNANIGAGECYEVLQVQEALLLCSGESAYSLSSILSSSSSSSPASPLSSSALSSLMPTSLSLPTSITESSLTASSATTSITTQFSSLSSSSSSVMAASSLSSAPSIPSSSLFLLSSSPSLSPPPPPASSSSSSLLSLSQSSSPTLVASLNVASGSTTTTSRRYSNSCSCDLCLEKNTMDFLKEALPCGHLFCQSCLLCLDNESCSSSSEDISCIIDGCKGYLALTEKTQKSTKVLEYCPFCKSLQLPQRELLQEDNTITTNSCSSTGASARYRCCYCQNRFSLSNF